MAKEFVARNGLISQNDSFISGTLYVTDNIVGDLEGTASQAVTSSHVNILNQNVTITGSLGIGNTNTIGKFHVTTPEISGRQNTSSINRTEENLIRITNPRNSIDSSVGILLKVLPDSDARQGAGVLASGGDNLSSTNLDLFVSTGDGSPSNITVAPGRSYILHSTGVEFIIVGSN